MRRFVALLLFSGIALLPAVALAQDTEPEGPVVDVAEVVGVIDRPIERYMLERIASAEDEGVALLVFQVDSLGAVKVDAVGLVSRVASASVPIALHVGPRAARAGGLVLSLAEAADLATIGPSAQAIVGLPSDYAARGDVPRPLGPEVEPGTFGANESVSRGLFDLVLPSVAELLRRADGMSFDGQTLSIPEDEVTVRFFQPGPIRRFLHTLANPVLVYLLLIGGAVLIMFELFQPGFGVAGVTGGLVLAAAGYGITVLPFRALGLGLLCGGLALLTIDVAMDGLGVPTALGTGGLIAGSILALPGTAEPVRLSPWIIGPTIAAALIMFVPVMTVVTRARAPIAREARKRLVGEPGQVRSMLNPEGFVSVEGEIWRARSKDGSRVEAGESVVVDGVDGAVLIVRSGSAPDSDQSGEPAPEIS